MSTLGSQAHSDGKSPGPWTPTAGNHCQSNIGLRPKGPPVPRLTAGELNHTDPEDRYMTHE
jgi:hypothetical protein